MSDQQQVNNRDVTDEDEILRALFGLKSRVRELRPPCAICGAAGAGKEETVLSSAEQIQLLCVNCLAENMPNVVAWNSEGFRV